MLSYIKHIKQRFFEDENSPNFLSDLWDTLDSISELRKQQLKKGKQHVIFYASGFLQKASDDRISQEDIDGFMGAFHGVKGKSLTLILHTPGGSIGAVETIVEYLHSKCEHIEVIVPAYAMSGGAVISLASDHIIMSKAGQIGPFDMQLGPFSAREIKESVDKVSGDARNGTGMADSWKRIDPLMIVAAEKGLSYTKQLVSNWLASRCLLADKQRGKIEKIAAYFNAEPDSGYGQIHLHEQRVGLGKLREMGLNVTALEDSQELQDEVMSAYWLMVQIFEEVNIDRFIASNSESIWVKRSTEKEIVEE